MPLDDIERLSRPATVADLMRALAECPPDARVMTRLQGAAVPIMLATDSPNHATARVVTFHAAVGRDG